MSEKNTTSDVFKWETTGGKISFNKGRKKRRPKENQKMNIVCFRLDDDIYNNLLEFSSPESPHKGARQIIEEKLNNTEPENN